MLSLFPHKYISRRELFTLSRGEPASDQRQHAEPDRFKDDVRIPRIAEIWTRPWLKISAAHGREGRRTRTQGGMGGMAQVVDRTGSVSGGHDGGMVEGGRRGVVPKTPPPPQLYRPRGIRSRTCPQVPKREIVEGRAEKRGIVEASTHMNRQADRKRQ